MTAVFLALMLSSKEDHDGNSAQHNPHIPISQSYISILCFFIYREGRYLLILTENFAALPRIKQLVLKEDKEEPYVIFGSSFPKDLSFTQARVNFFPNFSWRKYNRYHLFS